MAALGAGLATFASCNKAGSIPHFDRHLQIFPNDYTALMWRGRAYSIIKKPEKAIRDFQKAASVSYGAKKLLAESHVASMEGNSTKALEKLQTAVKTYPSCAEAWSELGSTQFYNKNHKEALPNLKKSIELGKISERFEPWYPWSNTHVGDIFYYKTEVKSAEPYYTEATSSCDSLTIAHLGVSRCSIINGNETRSVRSFNKAKELNPELVHWTRYSDFRDEVKQAFDAQLAKKHLLDVLVLLTELSLDQMKQTFDTGGRPSTSVGNESRGAIGTSGNSRDDSFVPYAGYSLNPMKRSYSSSRPSTSIATLGRGDSGTSRNDRDGSLVPYAGYSLNPMTRSSYSSSRPSTSTTTTGRGAFETSGNSRDDFAAGGRQLTSARNGGYRGAGGGGGNDGDDGDDGDDMWKKVRRASTSMKKLGDRIHFVKLGNYWLSRDKACHAGSYCKVYRERGSTLDFVGSVTKKIFKDRFQSNPVLTDFDIIHNKHESRENTQIKIKDLKGVK